MTIEWTPGLCGAFHARLGLHDAVVRRSDGRKFWFVHVSLGTELVGALWGLQTADAAKLAAEDLLAIAGFYPSTKEAA